jgi:LysR family transcriptional activator of nhaA
VSEQITELENYFGKKLLQKQKGHLTLTNEGQTAYQFASTIFTAGDRLKRALRSNPYMDGSDGPIEIGISSSVAELFNGEYFLLLFKNQSSKVRLRVRELSLLAEELFSSSLDIVLTERQLKELKGIQCEPVHSPSYSIVASPKMNILGKTIPAALEKKPFMHYTAYSPVKWVIDQYFTKNDFKPHVIGEADDTGIIKHAVLDGLCFAILPTSIAQKEIAGGELVSLAQLPEIDVKVYAYYHESLPSKHIRTIVDHLKQAL